MTTPLAPVVESLSPMPAPDLTPLERAKIEKRQDNISKDIYKQKHDAQKTTPKP